MAKTNHVLTAAEANRAYFLALADTRGSLNMFPLVAVLDIFFLSLLNASAFGAAAFKGDEVFAQVSSVNTVLIWMCVPFLVLAVIKKFTYRFQAFSSGVMAGMAVLLLYAICLMFLVLAAVVPTGGKQWAAPLFPLFGLGALVLVLGATVVHVVLLRGRLRVGHSEKRTMGNYVAVSGSNRSKTFLITFGVVAIVPNVLTQGQYLLNSVGILSLIFLACVMTSLPVEFTYLAYLKSKDRGYWEKVPRLTAKQRQRLKRERLRVAKKGGMWVFGVVAALALFWVLAKFLPIWLG